MKLRLTAVAVLVLCCCGSARAASFPVMRAWLRAWCAPAPQRAQACAVHGPACAQPAGCIQPAAYPHVPYQPAGYGVRPAGHFSGYGVNVSWGGYGGCYTGYRTYAPAVVYRTAGYSLSRDEWNAVQAMRTGQGLQYINESLQGFQNVPSAQATMVFPNAQKPVDNRTSQAPPRRRVIYQVGHRKPTFRRDDGSIARSLPPEPFLKTELTREQVAEALTGLDGVLGAERFNLLFARAGLSAADTRLAKLERLARRSAERWDAIANAVNKP